MNGRHFEPIIGLEIHVELGTVSKVFCGCPADWFGKKPNTQTCPVCLGLPGALPVPNKKAIEWTVLLGLALNCEIPHSAKFDRKHYFYPDLPKGYQISQYDMPFCKKGKMEIRNSKFEIRKTINIRRVHLEEDTGKLIHSRINGKKSSLVDFNRSGVPLMEIVTQPDFTSSEEAKEFLKYLQQTIRYLGISDCDMDKGSMRLEPNISLRKKGETDLPHYKVEVKNINSFRFATRAIEYEIKRQAEIFDHGEVPKQETRGYDEDKAITVSQRSKEEAHDYRYFPEPDIPPIRWTEAQIRQLADQIPELPDAKLERFMSDYQLPARYAQQLTLDLQTADYFEEAIVVAKTLKDVEILPKKIANWMINKQVNTDTIVPAELIAKIKKEVSKVLISDDELKAAIDTVIQKHPKPVADYKNGKEQAVMFLVGQVMRETKGKVDAQEVKKLLKKTLNTKL